MKIMKQLFVFCFACLSMLTAYSQSNCDRWYLGANYLHQVPLGEMNSNGFRHLNAVSFNLMYNLTPNAYEGMAVHIGGQMSGGITRSVKDRIVLDSPLGASAKSKVRNGLFDITGVLRFIFKPNARMSPYLEGKAGLRATGGDQVLKLDRDYNGFDRKTTDEINRKAAFVYGLAGGLLVKINEMADWDFRVTYSRGQSASYIDLDSYEINESLIDYQIVTTAAHSIGFQIGFRSKVFCNQYRDNNSNDVFYPDNRRSRKKLKRKKGRKKPATVDN